MRPLIEGGYVYIAQPPLYKVNKNEKSDQHFYAFSDEEVETKTAEKGWEKGKYSIQRFKGLGELNAEQLAQTVMSRETRSIGQINMKDLDEADNLFEILFGKDSNIRYDYIKHHSDTLYDLDV